MKVHEANEAAPRGAVRRDEEPGRGKVGQGDEVRARWAREAGSKRNLAQVSLGVPTGEPDPMSSKTL